ncbi:MAG: prepilin-type N-terminal cleavage/methylation domain-containing protein, partial [Synergistaceae bacterium]|nr:prepilin-type N-terminal cleavage/methylation domain-containing protein [Synergistaceae bacterium]
FTLIELLIVVAVLGLLSGAMMLSGVGMLSSSDATKIFSDMSNVKEAMLAWYINNYDRVRKDGDEFKIYYRSNGDKKDMNGFFGENYGAKEIIKYLDTSNSVKLANKNKTKNEEYYILRSVEKARCGMSPITLKRLCPPSKRSSKLAHMASDCSGLMTSTATADSRNITRDIIT